MIYPARITVLLLALVVLTPASAEDPSAIVAVQRGEHVFRLSGGCSCHTDLKNNGAFLAGGRPLKTSFGTFYAPNITPDEQTGIGTWKETDFIRAMTEGIGKNGEHLFPAFPYTSFTRMKRRDLKDLWAYLATVPSVNKKNRDHDLLPLLGFRFGVGLWKALYFVPGTFYVERTQSKTFNRGAYIVQALGHCGECHTPRNFAGGFNWNLGLAGSADGAEGRLAPNITPDVQTGIGDWSASDIAYYLKTGARPDGDIAGGPMGEIIDQGFRYATDSDLDAVAEYLKALRPTMHRVETH